MRVAHSFGQYEFRFKPISGKTLLEDFIEKGTKVCLFQPGEESSFSVSGYTVTFGGIRTAISIGDASNPEWIKAIRRVLLQEESRDLARVRKELSRQRTIGSLTRQNMTGSQTMKHM